MITDIAQLRIGDKVHYQPAHYKPAEWENGIIKVISEVCIGSENQVGVWVVYHCDGDWKHYTDYTGELTDLKDLTLGWKH